MFKAIGTSEPEIQENLRKFKLAQISNAMPKYKIRFGTEVVQVKHIKGMAHNLVEINAIIEDDLLLIGYIDLQSANYLIKNQGSYYPRFRGGDYIVKGYDENGQHLFTQEPLKVNEYDVYKNGVNFFNKQKAISKIMAEKHVKLTCEVKAYGLSFEKKQTEKAKA